MAEGDVVEVGVLGEETGEVGAGSWMRRGEGEVSADDGDEGRDGDEEDGGPAEDAAAGAKVVGVGLGEESCGHEGESRDGGEGVVLLTGGEGEETEDEERPEQESQGRFVLAGGGDASTKMGCPGLRDEDAEVLDEGTGEEGSPGHDPEDEHEPEEPDGGLTVVVGDAFGEEAGDVLVVEIEPGPATFYGQAQSGWQGDGGGAERGEDVPGGGDGEEDGGAGEEVELWEQAKLAGEGEVEEDKAEGEDESDEALGEEVEGHDGGEGEAGEEGRRGCCGRGERVAGAIVHLSDSETFAKMGLPALWWGLDAFEGYEEEVDGEGHPESEEDVWDVETGEEVGANAGGEGKTGVQASAVGVGRGGDGAEEADAKGVDAEEEGEDGEGEGETGGPVVLAEDTHGAGGHPVHEGRLVEEAYAVDVGGDEVVAVEHLACDLDVDGVDVVEEAGREDSGEVEGEPGEDKDGDGAGAPVAGGGEL